MTENKSALKLKVMSLCKTCQMAPENVNSFHRYVFQILQVPFTKAVLNITCTNAMLSHSFEKIDFEK